jgi:hypothetical protein
LINADVIYKDANHIQQYFSAEKKPTLWHALPAFEWLQTAWEAKTSNEKYKLYKDALADGLKKLKKYYTRFDEKPAYILALGTSPLLHTPMVPSVLIMFQSFIHITN